MVSQSYTKSDLLGYYSYTRKDQAVIGRLEDEFGSCLETLSRDEKLRLRMALTLWQVEVDHANDPLPLVRYLEDFAEAGNWKGISILFPKLWEVIAVLDDISVQAVDPLLECLSAQLASGIARK
jgi:hypothetical protein